MATSARVDTRTARRKSILDLAPLERDCMNILWPLGEGTVRQIRNELAAVRPRAYTTIMTIMDRLARKGVVTRRKVGRAYLYQPHVTAEHARAFAVEQLLENFFGGSAEALQAHLAEVPAGASVSPVLRPEPARPGGPRPDRPPRRGKPARSGGRVEPLAPREPAPATRIDESLL